MAGHRTVRRNDPEHGLCLWVLLSCTFSTPVACFWRKKRLENECPTSSLSLLSIALVGVHLFHALRLFTLFKTKPPGRFNSAYILPSLLCLVGLIFELRGVVDRSEMVRPSNSIIGLLNVLTFLLSVAVLGGGIWLAHRGSTDCEKFLQTPVIVIGAFLMAVSIAGLVGAWCGVTWLLWLYLLVMFLLIILLFCFTVFAFVVTNKGAGKVVSGRGYKEYRLGDYSNWLQKRVQNAHNWRKIKSCIQDAKICKSLGNDSVNEAAEQFYRRHLSPIQSGCCKPPTSCGFTYVNATTWMSSNGVSTDTDCGIWSNDQSVLCYDCSSCKAGLLANLKKDWRKIAFINIVVLVFLIAVYSIGCCAFRNNRRRDHDYGYKPGHP